MKKTFNLQYSILLFFGYAMYLLLEIPLNLIIKKFQVPILYHGFLVNIILLLPLIIFLILLLFKLKLESSFTTKNKKIFLIPVVYLVFVVIQSFSAFKNAVGWDFLIFLFGLCLVGFSEEILFRGILFQKFSSFFSSIYIAAVASSILFGIVHYINLVKYPNSFNEITSQVIFAFCIGILMCGIFYKTQNLYIPALIHTIINLSALIRTFNITKYKELPIANNKQILHPSLWELLNQMFIFNIICLLVGFFLIYYKNKDIGKMLIGGKK